MQRTLTNPFFFFEAGFTRLNIFMNISVEKVARQMSSYDNELKLSTNMKDPGPFGVSIHLQVGLVCRDTYDKCRILFQVSTGIGYLMCSPAALRCELTEVIRRGRMHPPLLEVKGSSAPDNLCNNPACRSTFALAVGCEW